MSRTKAKAVETWELGEVLAVLCQVAQDARETNSEPQAAENDGRASEPAVTDEGGSRS